jgi:hypothetical protein
MFQDLPMKNLPPSIGAAALALMVGLALGCDGSLRGSGNPGAGGLAGTAGGQTGGSIGGAAGGTGGSRGAGGSAGQAGMLDGAGGDVAGTRGDAAAGGLIADGSSASPADAAPMSAIPAAGLGPWTGKDNVPASVVPPGNFSPERVPLFVSLGFDDNPESRGVTWATSVFSALRNPAGRGKVATYDGTTTRATFYHSSIYAPAAASWRAAYLAGFETGDHTVNHFHGAAADAGKNFDVAGWTGEIQGCIDFLTGAAVGMRRAEIYGFRTPFLQYNANVFPAVKALDFWYDCSIQEGFEADQDGTNFFWPHTLDNGSPGHAANARLVPIATFPAGLWEMPAYRVIVPPDAEAARYGVPTGLRTKLTRLHPDSFTEASGQIVGLDFNLWYDFTLTKAEFLATLKYTFDQRRRGNRAPFLFGMHSAIYTDQTPAGPIASLSERQQAIDEFLRYALTFPEVRVVTTKAALDWIRNPVPLD